MSLEWMDRAACLEEDPELFMPLPSDNPAHAKAVCARCEVREKCLAYATANDMAGVWGGTTEDERRAARIVPRTDRPDRQQRPNDPTWDYRCGTYAGVGVHRRKDEALCMDCRAARSAAETVARRRKRQEAKA